jgi:LSD1 subclass zinc finger protein
MFLFSKEWFYNQWIIYFLQRIFPMTTSFNCPNCGAPLDFSGGDLTSVKCPFCHTTVIVPESMRTAPAATPAPNAHTDAAPQTDLPDLDKLDAMASLNITDRERRKIERAKRRIIRREVRAEVRKTRGW